MQTIVDSNRRDLHEQLLEQVAHARGRWRRRPLTAFAALRGAEDSGALMIVGRAVNGWTNEWYADEATDADVRTKVLDEAFAHSMLWVSELWGASEPYNTRKSAFWRVIRSTVGQLGVADVTEPAWPSFISWSNLYKVSPATGGNPSSALNRVQFKKCTEILMAEIQAWSPTRVLFLTGYGWAEPFLDTLRFASDPSISSGPVEASGTIFNGARIVVGPHPQTRPEVPLVAAIAESFARTNGT